MHDPTPPERYTGLNRLLRSRFVQTMKDQWGDGTFGTFLDDWRWIFSYSAQYKWAIVLYTALGILSSTLSLGAAVVSKYMIDIIIGKDVSRLGLLALLMLLSTGTSLLFSSMVSRISTRIRLFVHNNIQADIFEKIIDADWMELSRCPSGDLLNRFNSDVNTVATNAVSWLPTVIINLYSFAATFVVILHYDVTMAWIALGSAPFLLLASRYIMRRLQEHRRKVLEMNSNLMAFEVETFYNLDTIKSFGIAPRCGRKLRGQQDEYRDLSLEYNLFEIKSNIYVSLLGAAVSFAAFGYCLFRLWSDAITYGTMTLFLQQRSSLSSRFNSLVSIFPNMLNTSVSARRIRELVELPKERHDPASVERLAPLAAGGLTVRATGLDFSYKEGHAVIQGGEFIARPGEIVALVGASGEGKTTLLRLILGLVRPDAGQTVLEAADGTACAVNADLRRFFSYVPQGNTLFSGTVAENMRMVREDATDEEILDALRTACAWDFLEKMPDGIYSRTGERGRGFSEGQAQRIAIARAILRDAPILLLDEATSALDVATERRVLKNIVRRCPNKTCIVTTHRPSVLNLCQRVYRVMDAQVTELDEEESSRMAMDF